MNINSELLAGDARGKKQIPVAVFAVIFIHIVLFVLLLVAAGCRAKGRANKNINPPAPTAGIEGQKWETANAPGSNLVQIISPAETTTEPVTQTGPTSREQNERAEEPRRRNQREAGSMLYVVKAGDSLDEIARSHGTSVESIKSANKLKSNLIQIGQELKVERGTKRSNREA